MQGIKPTAGLVYSFSNEICGESQSFIDQVFIFKRIVPLRVRHRTRIKPHVDQVSLALHRLAFIRYQSDGINERLVQIKGVVVFIRHIGRVESIERIVRHHTCFYGVRASAFKLFNRTYAARLLAIFCPPYRNWNTPKP